MNPSHNNRRFIALVAMALFAVLAPPSTAQASKTPPPEKTDRVLLAGGQDVLVIVGAGHLLGRDSLPELLRKKGYRVEQK